MEINTESQKGPAYSNASVTSAPPTTVHQTTAVTSAVASGVTTNSNVEPLTQPVQPLPQQYRLSEPSSSATDQCKPHVQGSIDNTANTGEHSGKRSSADTTSHVLPRLDSDHPAQSELKTHNHIDTPMSNEPLNVDVNATQNVQPESIDATHSIQSPISVMTSYSEGANTSPHTSPSTPTSTPTDTGSGQKRRDTSQKKRKRRGSAWSDEQTEFLMEIWARQTEQNKEGADDFNHNAPVYRIIARAMEETGNPKSWEQCKTRIHTLKRAYKLTKDEITSGATNITYCRHFEKLEIIMGDNETTTPQMLADSLEERRKNKREQAPSEPQPVKRKIPQPNRPSKRPNTNVQDGVQVPGTVIPQQPQQFQNISSTGVVEVWKDGFAQEAPDSTVPTPSYNWYPQAQPKYEQGQAGQQTQQQREVHASPGYQYNNSTKPTSMPPPPSYPVLTNTLNSNNHLHTTTEINNNEIAVKAERHDNAATQEHSISTMTSQTWPIIQPPQKEELEKMRLDLEIRKIDMERNKLEMEERQRREERDHQYRMLQLLMFGLGQQNSPQCLPGQGAEQVVAHAQHSTDLSRALENGLVPGGPHSANEKGLSFNEI